jgi:hypothetical protein
MSQADMVRHEFAPLIEAIPEGGSDGDDAWVTILGSILDASSANDLDNPWRSNGLAQYKDKVITVHGVKRMPSDQPGPFAWYLVLDAEDNVTRERVVISTGATGPMAQLVKAFHLNAFPLQVIPRVAERPTASGGYPQHLEIPR